MLGRLLVVSRVVEEPGQGRGHGQADLGDLQ